MKFSIDKQEKYTVFKLQEANLNSMLAPNLKSEFVLLHSEGVSNLIFDLSEVAFVDSSGLSAILTANRLWKENGSFIMTGVVHPSIIKLIDISRLNNVLTIIPTLEEAIEYVFMSEIERELMSEGED